MKTRSLLGLIILVLILIGVGWYLSWIGPSEEGVSPGTTTDTQKSTSTESTGNGGLVKQAPTSTMMEEGIIASSSVSTQGGSETGSVSPRTVVVTYSNSGYSPQIVTIHEGDTVRWANNSSISMWTASGVHPSHTLYDDTSRSEHCSAGYSGSLPFDSCHGVAPGGSYSFMFTETGTHPYHNHLSADDTGKVIVE